MYNVLIAEDEMLVRIGIKNSVQWQNYDMTVVGDVANGQQAWEIIQSKRVDILITDIKMPVMDGFQLILKLRENNYNTHIVILTCVEDFKTAQQAISLGVSGYISKLAIGECEINTILAKIKEELDKDYNVNAEKSFRELQGNSSLKQKSEVFRDYLFYKIYSDNEMKNYIKDNGLRLGEGRLRACIMEIDNYEEFKVKFNDREGHLICTIILNILEEILNILKIGEIIYNNNKRFCILLDFNNINSEQKIHEETIRIIERIKNDIRTYFGISVSFGISSVMNDMTSLREIYQEGIRMLDYKFFFGKGKVCFYSSVNQSEIYGEIFNSVQNVVNSLKDNIGEEYKREVLKIFSAIRELSEECPARIKNIFIHAANYPNIIAQSTQNFYDIQQQFIETVIAGETIDEILEAYKEYLNSAIIKNIAVNISKEVVKTIKFIEENYNKDISLQGAATFANIRPSYLSTLFKNEMGMNFVEYLMKIRVDKARDLLVNTNMKSYEIANRTGFNDDSYFSRTFKKMTGHNPLEYRKRFFPDDIEKYPKEAG